MFLFKDDWHLMFALLPALVLAKPLEKPSIIRQRNALSQNIARLSTTNIKFTIPDNCLKIAAELWNCGVKPEVNKPPQDEILKGLKVFEQRCEANLNAYNNTLTALLDAILEKEIHRPHRELAMYCILELVHPDHILPAPVVRYFLGALLSELITERKVACAVLWALLSQLKKPHVKVII